MTLEIRKLTPGPVDRFVTLFGQVFEESFSHQPRKKLAEYNQEAVKAMLADDDYLVLVTADFKGFLIGKYKPQEAASDIRWLGVLKPYQGRGTGKALVAAWERWAREKGAVTLRLSTYKRENRGFYERLGFTLWRTVANNRDSYLKKIGPLG